MKDYLVELSSSLVHANEPLNNKPKTTEDQITKILIRACAKMSEDPSAHLLQEALDACQDCGLSDLDCLALCVVD